MARQLTHQLSKPSPQKKPNIKHQFGIEAGTHEDPKSIIIAAEFTAAVTYNLAISAVSTEEIKSNKFNQYKVGKALSFLDLLPSREIADNQTFYPAKIIPESELSGHEKIIAQNHQGEFTITNSKQYSRGKAYAIHQFEETEAVRKGQVVAVSVPGGIELSAPHDFAGIFVTKSAEFYSDPAIGLYPVTADKMATKFCYPCEVSEITVNFATSRKI